MNKFTRILASLLAVGLLGACATSRSVLDIQAPTGQAATASGKQVFINSAVDKRIFQPNASSPDIPSLDPGKNQDDTIKNRAVGRKRNGFGKALGDIVLKEGQSVETLTTNSIRQAFLEKGYTIINNKEQIGKDTYVVDANIEKFWAWMNPGFAAITLSTEIATEINIKAPTDSSKKKIYVKAADGFQLGTESNWMEVINRALRLYVDDLKSKLD
jgi:uncharacterized lipoprotein YajG